LYFVRCDARLKSFQKEAFNSSVNNENLKLCCGTDCCSGFPDNARDDFADKEETFKATSMKFWIIVMGVLMGSAIMIHCVCMIIQTAKQRTFLRSVTEHQGKATTVGEHGNIVPKVEYLKESLSDQPDRQENTKYDTLPLKPGYQHTNQVLQVWKPEIQMESLYNFHTLNGMVYPQEMIIEQLSICSL
jgi:hypothetical protein